jgi:endonuclease YncB( thermonuclease family)
VRSRWKGLAENGQLLSLIAHEHQIARSHLGRSGPRGEDERRRADAATARLRGLIAGGNAHLTRVACSCRQGQEGTRNCNFGRLCGVLLIGGRDAGQILISEGLAHPFVCGATSCPPRRPWCDGR